MDTEQEAVDYDAMDHRAVNRVFVDDFLRTFGGTNFERRATVPLPEGELRALGQILDIGTGTAQIPIELLRRPVAKFLSVTAVDRAAHMLRIAAGNVLAAGLVGRIHLELADAKRLPHPSGRFIAVMSNSIIHHIPEPLDALSEMVRVLSRQGGNLFVRDLVRPDDYAAVDRLVETYAGDANGRQQAMFRASLCAALTLDEVRDLLRKLNLPVEWAGQTSDRHWTISNRLVTPDEPTDAT